MKGRSSKTEGQVTPDAVAAFRLRRHYLAGRSPADPAAICSDVCGVQAQVMGFARMALWVRAENLTRQEMDCMLWERRTLVKTSAMRQTLHLLPADDYHIYITALKRSRMTALMRIMARLGITPRDVEAMNAALLDILNDAPIPQRALAEGIYSKVGKKLGQRVLRRPDPWMNSSWWTFRSAIIEGLICYGPEQGREATLVRVDRWLPKTRPVEEDEAKRILLRGYLGAYGPAALRDFCVWSGISVKEAAPLWESLRDEMAEISVEDQSLFILRKDQEELIAGKLRRPIVRLLPGFDPYMLAHREKDHLVHSTYYKRIYRNQGWISPVILVNGRAAGIWSYARERGKAKVQLELFEKLSKPLVASLAAESKRTADWLDAQRL